MRKPTLVAVLPSFSKTTGEEARRVAPNTEPLRFLSL